MEAHRTEDKNPLLGDVETAPSYGTHEDMHEDDGTFTVMKHRGWSFQESRRLVVATTSADHPEGVEPTPRAHHHTESYNGVDFYLYCLVYAIVNVIISAPGLYGYAAVIFNNPVFNNHMNALSKLVIFSSLVHQLGFFLFSSLDFAIGTVQDAGLIFLSGMANIIANEMSADGHSEEEIVSTTLVLLSLGTAALGLVLVLMGKFRLADVVSYLPMPVVGGYLAFIGYFCIQAGVSMCISTPMMSIVDFKYLFVPNNLLLAMPGLVAGLVLTLTSRNATSSGILPIVMVSIPAIFYLILWLTGSTLEDAREEGWVGPVAPTVPVSDLFRLVKFNQVRWDLILEILPTWLGMVFVVSFASCLDVAAISIDMGEALDTNRELATVGICNFLSGLTFGYTGSYIFSQTIFTYRTGVHSRLIGVMIMCVFLYIVVSPVNVLEISPLFFLGSTLIFIGYDLMFEWLWEVRHQVFLSEYAIVWLTFCAIQFVGINAGIVIGVLIAVVEQIFTTAQASSVSRVEKRSRAVWQAADAKILHTYAYSNVRNAKIVTMEMHGTVFFGSSLSLFSSILSEIGLNQDNSSPVNPSATPRTPAAVLTPNRTSAGHALSNTSSIVPPQYLVLDLTRTTHLDASAARGCFLQLVKMCSKYGILVCASSASARIEWMFRSHGVSIPDVEEEEAVKAKILCEKRHDDGFDKMLLFMTVYEALEFCENAFLHRMNVPSRPLSVSQIDSGEEQSLEGILVQLLESGTDELSVLKRLAGGRYHEEIELRSGEQIFGKNTYPDGFYIVISGVVANSTSSGMTMDTRTRPVVSGAGPVTQKRVGSASNLFDEGFKKSLKGKTVLSLWNAGGVLGYNDFLLDRPRTFRALATLDGTKVARFTRSHLNLAQSEDPEVAHLVQKLLLRASTYDLANCTCRDV